MPAAFSLERAGRWFLHSGIQEPSGGVARYYQSDLGKNNPVSTEITGYTASALVFLFHATGDSEFLDRARLTARFLIDRAWDPSLQTFPFESPSPSPGIDHHAYFFDCGIIIRGLLAVYRVTREDRLLDVAAKASAAMIRDFCAGSDFHPILALPGKKPLPRDTRWSRAPGCYQLKSALAWYELFQLTGDQRLRDAWSALLDDSLRTHSSFLPGASDPHRVMDRLHPECYFLEALTPVLDRPECVAAYSEGLNRVSHLLRSIAPEFVRSDVYAQLLRARLFAAPVIPLDREAAREEALALAAFQAASSDSRIDGSFWFGRLHGNFMPYANPVSTAFAVQALEMWRSLEAGKSDPCRLPPI